jgi:hypothetical protein
VHGLRGGMHISTSGAIKDDEGYKSEEGTIHGYAEEEEEEEGVESAEDEEEGTIH